MTDKSDRDAQLGRIRALMAKTVAAGCTEAEARAAAAAVDRLLSVYEISLDEVTVHEQKVVELIVPGIADHDVKFSANQIGGFTDCIVWFYHGRDIKVLGFQVDTEIAEYLLLLFKRAIDREAINFTVFNADYDAMDAVGRSNMMHSFRVGMASRLGDRLSELKSKRDMTRRSSGTDLVAIKMPIVQSAFDAMGIVLGAGKAGRSIRDTAAYNAGRTAADGVKLSAGIASRAAAAGRIK